MKDNLKYIMYLRKSTEGDDRQVQSIDSQKFDLDQMCKSLGLNIVEIVQEEKSAQKPFNRPIFTEMIKKIENGTYEALVVWESSRISRNPTESGMIQQLLQDGKLKRIRTMTRTFEPEDNAIIFSVDAAVSNQYSIELKRRAIRGYRAKVRNGQLSGRAPEGYINVNVNDVSWIEKDPVRFSMIRKVFDMYLSEAYTVSEIKKYLEEIGYKTIQRKKSGDKPLSRSAIYKILTNPRYYGKIPHPDFPNEADKMHDAKFPKMITRDEFERVQQLLGTKGRSRYVTRKDFELKGLLRCGECGGSVTAERKNKLLKDGSINFHTYYHCTHKKPCNQKAIKEPELFESVESLLIIYELPTLLYEWGLDAIKKIAQQEVNQRIGNQYQQRDAISTLERKKKRLLELVTDSTITSDDYKSGISEVDRVLKALRIEEQEAINRSKNWYETVGNTLEMLHDATTDFKNGDRSIRKDILFAIGYNPILVDRKMQITPYEWLRPLETNLPSIKAELEKVITDNFDISQSVKSTKKDSEESLMSSWQGYVESNHGFRFWRPTH